MFFHSQSIKEDIMLWTETQTAANLFNISPDVVAVDVGRATGWGIKPYKGKDPTYEEDQCGVIP